MKRRSVCLPKRGDFITRFWRSVRKTNACWLWRGAPTTWGYGKIRRDGSYVSAHRASWELHHGPVPEGLCVLHRCDVRLCVRPDHLFVGTQAENVHDAMAKQRHSAGVRHGMAKLDERAVRAIFTRRQSGETLRAIASDFGVSKAAVSLIARGRNWKQATAGLHSASSTKER